MKTFNEITEHLFNSTCNLEQFRKLIKQYFILKDETELEELPPPPQHVKASKLT
jgi:hypothetical protein